MPLLTRTVERNERELQARACKMFTNQRDAGEAGCPPRRERLFGTVCIRILSTKKGHSLES